MQTAETIASILMNKMVFEKIDSVRTTYSHSHQLSEIENVKDYPHILSLLILKKHLME